MKYDPSKLRMIRDVMVTLNRKKKDGIITEEEMAEAYRLLANKVFSAIDGDGDGVVSVGELIEYYKSDTAKVLCALPHRPLSVC